MASSRNFEVMVAFCIVMVMIMSCLLQSVVGWKVEEVKGWKGEELKVVHVGGKVMCQDCTQGWNHWDHETTPLKGCNVAVTCMDARKRVVYYVSDETDEQGEFEIPVSKYVDGKELKPEGCSVRLVSSPDQTCNVMTNSGGGQSGVKLYRPSHIYPGMVKYTVGPFYFTSPMCDEPDTSESGNGSGY